MSESLKIKKVVETKYEVAGISFSTLDGAVKHAVNTFICGFGYSIGNPSAKQFIINHHEQLTDFLIELRKSKEECSKVVKKDCSDCIYEPGEGYAINCNNCDRTLSNFEAKK